MPSNTIAYFGHHKCASTYIVAIIRDLCAHLGLQIRLETHPQRLALDYHLRESHRSHAADLKARWKDMKRNLSASDFLINLNAEQEFADMLTGCGVPFKGFHVIRDPRDIMISGYFSHKISHPVDKNLNPWMLEHRNELLQLDLENGLLCELDYSEPYFERLSKWNYRQNNIYETRFERITPKPFEEFLNIFRFVGLPFDENGQLVPEAGGKAVSLADILKENSFERSGRVKGQEDPNQHTRKGIVGDWQNYFTPTIAAAFKKRYGQLLVLLGYEKDENWTGAL
jgi:hypothetical protein